MNKSSLALLALLSLLCACSSAPSRTDYIANPVGSGETGGTQTSGENPTGGDPVGGQSGPGTGGDGTLGCTKMDILFVIDNSESMKEEQANLAANFPKFIDVLNAFQGGSLDYHVGVTTTSFPSELLGRMVGSGAAGALLKTNGMTRPWVERANPGAVATFTKLAMVGLGGSGNEQPLRAARAAVTQPVADAANKGFLREDALLAVVILTDEEDSSREPAMAGSLWPPPPPPPETSIADVVAALDMAKGDRSRWATTVIAGDQAPECKSQFGKADHAPRLLDFVKQTGKNGVFSSICDGDLSLSLEDALKTFSVACDNFGIF